MLMSLFADDILRDKNFKEATAAIQKRSERQLNTEKLIDIFVQTDFFARTASTDTQLIMGRRGTGKTHLIRFFAEDRRIQGDHVLYVDCTKFGSGYSSIGGLNEYQIACKYFTVLLNEIGTHFFDNVIEMENPDEQLQDSLVQKLASLSGFFQSSENIKDSHFNYRQINDSLEQILKGLNIPKMYILIDEWAQIPLSAQPHFAEFIKRAILPIPKICLKILAVNYQCEFFKISNGEHIGIQRGADLTDVMDLDTYLIYDEKREQVVNFFGQVLYNHLGAELGWPFDKPSDVKLHTVEALFTQRSAFIQLVRAAEGNCRDFLCIFGRAYFDGFLHTPDARKISISNVETASAQWFDNEKLSNIKIEANVQSALTHIYDRVLKNYKARTFMVHISKTQNHLLLRLLNERVVHKLNITYSHKDEPGERFELFTLDYGAYVRFKGTENEPFEQFMFENSEMGTLNEAEAKFVVPLDDHRSIRRIVFDPETLKARP